MCSRYFLDADGNIIAYTFQVPVHDRIRKRFNIAPTQDAPVVRAAKQGGREAAMLRWGLVPFWAKDLKIGSQMINARAETVAEKPAFRHALQQRRCLVPATGFFEWKGEPGRKQAFAITVPERPLFAFAGLWERWKPRDDARRERRDLHHRDDRRQRVGGPDPRPHARDPARGRLRRVAVRHADAAAGRCCGPTRAW